MGGEINKMQQRMSFRQKVNLAKELYKTDPTAFYDWTIDQLTILHSLAEDVWLDPEDLPISACRMLHYFDFEVEE